jgi:hypothetical protein
MTSLNYSEIIDNNNNNDSENSSRTYMDKKRTKFNKTCKLKNSFDLDKYATYGIENFSNLEAMETEDDHNLASYDSNFNPPSHPELTTNQDNNSEKENKQDKQDKNEQNDSPLFSEDKFNKLQNNYAQQLYDKYTPNSNYASNLGSITNENRDEILRKINYMIHLLEEQKDYPTSHVTEEVILYMFLGVFMIFVLDNFSKTAKYTR